MKLKKGDPVIVVTGNDKGKEGKIRAFKGNRVVVEGVNMRKKHQKPSQAQQKGSIIEFEASIDRSNIAYCVSGKPVKVRTRISEDGKKELYYRDQEGKETAIRTL